jgi:predicted transcriptional regulator
MPVGASLGEHGKTDKVSVFGPVQADNEQRIKTASMKNHLSLVSLLGRRRSGERLPDLGERELGVLQVLWQTGPLTAQRVREGFADSGVSLSTVQSTLERLYRKGLLKREKAGRAFVYSALLTRQSLISRLMHDIAESLTDGDTAPMVSGFLDYLGEYQGDGEPAAFDETADRNLSTKGRRPRR